MGKNNVKDLNLPEGYSISEVGRVSMESAREIIDHCHTCLKKGKCQLNLMLRTAMAEDLPYWPGQFIFIEGVKENSRVVNSACTEYKSEQSRLEGVSEYSDGIERAIELSERGLKMKIGLGI